MKKINKLYRNKDRKRKKVKKIKICITEVERFPVYDTEYGPGVGFDEEESYLIEESILDWVENATEEYGRVQDFLEAVFEGKRKYKKAGIIKINRNLIEKER